MNVHEIFSGRNLPVVDVSSRKASSGPVVGYVWKSQPLVLSRASWMMRRRTGTATGSFVCRPGLDLRSPRLLARSDKKRRPNYPPASDSAQQLYSTSYHNYAFCRRTSQSLYLFHPPCHFTHISLACSGHRRCRLYWYTALSVQNPNFRFAHSY